MSDINVKIGADASQAKQELDALKKNASNTAKGIKSPFENAMQSVKSVWTGAITAMVALLGYLAVKANGVAAAFEQTSLSFRVMMGDAAKSSKLLADLNKFSNDTPFTPEQVFSGGKQQLSFGFDPGDIIPNLTMIGDIASGTGKDFNELGLIFGKVFAKGKMDSQDLNQMAEAGIPIVKTLGQMYNATGGEIYDMASKGKLSFADLKTAFAKMTGEGGIFSGMMKQQAQTFNGVMSTLKGNVADIGRSIAESWLPALKEAAALTNKMAGELQARRDERKIVATGDNGAIVSRSSFYRAKLDEKGVGHATLRDHELSPFITPDIEYEANRIFGLNGDQISREAFAAKISGSKFTAAPAPGGRGAKEAKETDAFRAEAERQNRAENEQYEKDAAKIAEANKELEQKTRIQELVNQGKEREAAIQEEINRASKELGRDLKPEEAAQISTRAGAAYDAKADAAIKEQTRALDDKLKVQQLLLQGKEREAAIMEAIAAAEKKGKLTAEQRQQIGDKVGLLYDSQSLARVAAQAPQQSNANIITDSVLQGGGYHGGQATLAQQNLIERQLTVQADILSKITEINNKISNATNQQTGFVWPKSVRG